MTVPITPCYIIPMKGSEVRRIRRGLRLTQGGLAKLVGVHWVTVNRWENGKTSIPEPTAKLIWLLALPKKGR